MDDPDVILADPWLKETKSGTSLPQGACFACVYELNLGIDEIDEAVFLRRTEATDELWIDEGPYPPVSAGITGGTASAEAFEEKKLSRIGCAFVVPRKGDEVTACLSLLGRLFRARHGFQGPAGFVAPGLVDKTAYDGLVVRFKKELDRHRQKTQGADTEIVTVARDFGLSPQPTGHGPSHWAANCPETNHQLDINAATNSFGCGWCKRNGGAEDLRAFVKERRDHRSVIA